jgi:glycosyltransferase involved in cell wall biosynthesis
MWIDRRVMMKIAFLLNSLAGGGAERVSVTVANEMAMTGHEVSLILNHKKGPYLQLVDPLVRVVSLEKRMIWALPLLLSRLRRERLDTIFTVLDQPSVGALLLKPFLGTTRVVVVECNNPNADPTRGRLLWRAVRALRRRLYPMANGLVAKSEAIKAALIADYGCSSDKVFVIPNPVDTSHIAQLAAENVQHPWLKIGQRTPVIVAAGRLEVQKDYPTLIRAFSELRRTRDAKLLILGRGSLEAELRQLVIELELSAHVDFVGFESNPYAYFSAADVFAISSKWEGWPNALAEALACGTSVVATDCVSGPREILADGEFGLLVPVGDVRALAIALDAAIKKPWPPQTLKARAAEFSVSAATVSYLAAGGASCGN